MTGTDQFDRLVQALGEWDSRASALSSALVRVIDHLDEAVRELRCVDHDDAATAVALVQETRDHVANAAFGSLGSFQETARELQVRARR